MAFFHVGRWTTVEVAAAAVEAEVAFFGQKNENSLTFFLSHTFSRSLSSLFFVIGTFYGVKKLLSKT